jgi:hypothetical protein
MIDLGEQLSAQEIAERADIDAAFRAVFSTPEGKRVMFWMLEQCAIYGEAYAGEHTNATNYTLGLQAGGRKLIAKLEQLDPRYYPTLLMAVAQDKAMKMAARERTNEPEDDDDAAT